MSLIVREVQAKSILSRSGIEGISYTVNPYTGCAHACRYCYATFMKRYTGHTEPWGQFVDIKVNAPGILLRQIQRAPRGIVIMSSVTDPYQPIEATWGLTRSCLTVLSDHEFPVQILTKSPLVLRDIDLLKRFTDIEVGITITTENDRVRKVFEPKAPTIAERLHALKTLHEHGVSTYAFVGPLLPMQPALLAESIRPYVGRVLIDRMNYLSKTLRLYKALRLTEWLDSRHLDRIVGELSSRLPGVSVEIC
jgi:DNA repair photolyase